jgi:hypothetical protein
MGNGIQKSIHMKQEIRYKINLSAYNDGFETTSDIYYYFIGCEMSPEEVHVVNIFNNRCSEPMRWFYHNSQTFVLDVVGIHFINKPTILFYRHKWVASRQKRGSPEARGPMTAMIHLTSTHTPHSHL